MTVTQNASNSSLLDLDSESDMILINNVKLILCSTCIVAVLTNLKVFTCIHWIRRPLTSVLKISLSLALADSFASCTSGIVIFFEEYITFRYFILLEMIRLCFILITVFHLLGLAVNHYMGIHKPLRHNSKSSQKSISGISFLWLLPTVFIFILYTSAGGYSFWVSVYNDDLVDDTLFIHSFRFRMVFSSFIMISIICIMICYFSILRIIEKQKSVWNKLSFGGSTVWKGHSLKRTIDRHTNHVQNRLKSNSKAVCTTLIIMGSCFVGWIPALTIYTIACSQDCFINGELLEYFNDKYRRQIIMLRFFDNEMLFLKMIANPIIYSIRMKEIQEGTKKMHNSFLHCMGGRKTRKRKATCSSFANSGSSNAPKTSLKLPDRKSKNVIVVESEYNL
ncbi:hypothetical protein HHI36_018978, partial [Cryptolaemus montrouzieri]